MKTFEDLIILSRTEPTVYSYLMQLEIGNMTREQAIIGMVMTLVEQKRDVTDSYLKHIERCVTPSIRK